MDFNFYYQEFQNLLLEVWNYFAGMQWNEMSIWVTITATIAVIAITVLHLIYKRIKIPNVRIPELEQNNLRFRKRDKVKFYARKVFRKGQDAATRLSRHASAIRQNVSIPEFSRSGRRLRKRERMLILAKRMFHVKQEPPKLMKKELPSVVLEADLIEEQKPNLPEEVMYLLQSVKVFGQFEKGIFFQLCRHMEIFKVEKDKYLFRIGDPDEYMYVIQDGQINLYICDNGLEVKLSEFTAGESLHSLLSILDVLTGHSAPYKTVFARAVKDSTVIRLPVHAFNIAFENRQDALVQMVQVIMTRMQRVTFLALHNCLGLSYELLNPTHTVANEQMSIHRLSKSSTSSMLSQFSQEIDEPEDTDEPKDVSVTKDVTDSTTLEVPTKSNFLQIPRVKSQPILSAPTPESKQLRFGGVVTVMDNNDNIFQRQASLPLAKAKRNKIKDMWRESVVEANAAEELERQLFGPTDSFSSFRSNDGIVFETSAGYPFTSDDSFASNKTIVDLNEPEILDLVVQDLMILFGIDNKEMLKDHITLHQVPKNCELIQEGDQDVSIYFIVFGELNVYQAVQHREITDEIVNVNLFRALPGMLTGQLAVLTGEPSFFSVSANKNSVIAKLKRKDFYSIMQHYPRMVLNTAHTVVQRVSRFTRQIDFALDWTLVEAGKALYKQDTLSDCMYIILHGRLRSVREHKDGGKKELVSEFGRGEIVGMMEALRGTKRSVSMHAVRDTELAKIPEGLLKHIRKLYPSVLSHLVSLVSDKLIGSMSSSRNSYRGHPGELLSHKHQMGEETKFAYGDVSNHLANLSSVAVLPVNRDVPVEKFTMELEHALSAICEQVLHLNSDTVKKRLGQSALDSQHEYRLTGWLAQQEDLHRMVLYQTDYNMTAWTQRCIRQSDAVLIVAEGDSEPNIGELEQELENYSVRALKVLVLLHRPEVSQPTRTVEWLNMRGWLTDHLHIKGSKRLFAKTRKSKLAHYREKLQLRDVDRFSDFSRLARFLTGTSVALVLGGGGARGISQIGIIKSLLEAGVPVDHVGGTSIGAFIGALWAAHRDLTIVRSKTAIFSSEMGSVLPKLFDLTYPITSMFSGTSFNRGLYIVFGETQIEDLWLPYYTITTDITCPKMRVHTDGLLWQYVRASMSFTPYLPPMCDPKDGHYLLDGCYINNVPGTLWRYVRGSMSLSGYLPPICDPKDGHLLMDGGYINNLPGDVARSRGACKVIAVDVAAESQTDFTNYGDHLSGWWLLWKKWTGRWTGQVKIPDMNEIQSRLSYISCHYIMDLVINSDYCTYLRPPVAKYSTMEFAKWQELLEVGYKYGKEVCTEEWGDQFWRELHQIGSDQQRSTDRMRSRTLTKKTSRSNMKANASITDLSELLRKKSSDDGILFGGTDLSDMEYIEYGYDSEPGTSEQSLHRVISEPLSEPDEVVSDDRLFLSHDDDSSSTSSDEHDGVLMRKFSSQNVLNPGM